MNEHIEKMQSMLMEINRILNTENLKPGQRKGFLDMQKYLGDVLHDRALKNYRQQLEIEAFKRQEKDLGPLVGESRRVRPEVRLPNQFGGVKTYGRDIPATAIRQFHPNINYDMDRGLLRQLLFGNRRDRI